MSQSGRHASPIEAGRYASSCKAHRSPVALKERVKVPPGADMMEGVEELRLMMEGEELIEEGWKQIKHPFLPGSSSMPLFVRRR